MFRGENVEIFKNIRDKAKEKYTEIAVEIFDRQKMISYTGNKFSGLNLVC